MIYIRGFPPNSHAFYLHRFLYRYGGHMSFYKFVPEISTVFVVFNYNNWGGQTGQTIRELNGSLFYGWVLEVGHSFSPVYTESPIVY